MHRYIKKILTTRVYDVAIESPLDPRPRLSRRLHKRVLLKREDLQPVFSFKRRGTYNKIVSAWQKTSFGGANLVAVGHILCPTYGFSTIK